MWPIDSKEERPSNTVPIKIQTDAKNSNKLCVSHSTKSAKVTKNSSTAVFFYLCEEIFELVHALFSSFGVCKFLTQVNKPCTCTTMYNTVMYIV